MALVAKTVMTVAMPVSFVYSMELYPTEVRSYGGALTFTVSRLGSVVAPYLGNTLVSLRLSFIITVYVDKVVVGTDRDSLPAT